MIAASPWSSASSLGLVLRPTVPTWLEPYLPIAVVAALDAVFGGIRARLDGIFDAKVFVVSFISNVAGRRADRVPRRQARRRRRSCPPRSSSCSASASSATPRRSAATCSGPDRVRAEPGPAHAPRCHAGSGPAR